MAPKRGPFCVSGGFFERDPFVIIDVVRSEAMGQQTERPCNGPQFCCGSALRSADPFSYRGPFPEEFVDDV